MGRWICCLYFFLRKYRLGSLTSTTNYMCWLVRITPSTSVSFLQQPIFDMWILNNAEVHLWPGLTTCQQIFISISFPFQTLFYPFTSWDFLSFSLLLSVFLLRNNARGRTEGNTRQPYTIWLLIGVSVNRVGNHLSLSLYAMYWTGSLCSKFITFYYTKYTFKG